MSDIGPRGSCEPVPPVEGTDLAPTGLGFLLGVAHRSRRRAWEAELADLDLTAPQAALLRLVTARPGHGVRQLARELGTDAMNVQRVASSLVAAGLCEAGHDPGDARRRPLRPTALGARLADVLARRAELAEAQLARALGTARYRTVLASLQEIVEHDRRALGEKTTSGASRSEATP